MGCSTSKPAIEGTDDLSRICKVRTLHIKNAIKYRQNFAAAHMAYIHGLKDVGLALKCFTGSEFLDMDVPSQPSSAQVLALQPPSLSSLGDLSPPRASDFFATALSPPHSFSGERGDVRLKLPPNISISPPLSPMRLPVADNQSVPRLPQSTTPTDSPSESAHHMTSIFKTTAKPVRTHSLDESIVPSRTEALNNVVSPDRESEFPSSDDLDEALVEYCPPPPSSLITDTTTWFNLDEFTPPVIPQHLQEQRRMKRANEHKVIHGPGELENVEEDIPELEEPDHKEDESVHDGKDTIFSNTSDVILAPVGDRDALLGDNTISNEAENRVGVDETVGNSSSKINEDEVVNDIMEEFVLNTTSLQRKSADSCSLDGECASNANPAPVFELKEKTLTEAMQYIYDFCLQAYQCGCDVSRMLETQIHHRPKADDSLKAPHSITSPWSTKMPYLGMEDVDEDGDVLECGMSGSHVSTLERLYAWERKLHHEVKEGRMLRTTFDRKFKELHILNAKGSDQVQCDRLKATLKKLDMRLLVSIKAIGATSSRIEELTNDELYPQLCELLEGLKIMWRRMAECHKAQTAIALEFQMFESLTVEIEATDSPKQATVKLKQTLLKLQTDLQCWIWSQSKYIHELNEWIRKCYDEVTDLNEKSVTISRRASSDQTQKSPIFWLLKAWRSSILDLNPDTNVSGIKQFTAAMLALEEDQFVELRSKRQVEQSTRRLGQKTVFLEKLERNKTERKQASLVFSPSRLLNMPSSRSIPQKRALLDKYKTQAETEKHHYFTAVETRKNATAHLLQQQLPLLFQSLSSIAKEAESMYEKVKEIAEESGNPSKQKGTARLTWEVS